MTDIAAKFEAFADLLTEDHSLRGTKQFKALEDACKDREQHRAAQPSGESQYLEKQICGDAVNGGLIRTISYTVWEKCHNPTHADGNTDWFNDTLPTVNVMVENIRELIKGFSRPAPQAVTVEEFMNGLEHMITEENERLWVARYVEHYFPSGLRIVRERKE